MPSIVQRLRNLANTTEAAFNDALRIIAQELAEGADPNEDPDARLKYVAAEGGDADEAISGEATNTAAGI